LLQFYVTALENCIIIPYKDNYNKLITLKSGQEINVMITGDHIIYTNIQPNKKKYVYIQCEEYDNNKAKLYMSQKKIPLTIYSLAKKFIKVTFKEIKWI
jgi:antitoxin component of MazEF toxin-antitoxin module